MYIYIKSFLDILFSLILTPFILILIFFFGILIKIEDSGPIFYKAKRIGKNGRIFDMLKLRSMRVDAPDIRLPDGSTFNSSNDSRVTRIGRFIRKTSIDELPQIINILIGDMSFVGPRPDSACWINNYSNEERILLTVRPGITGYNQAINRNTVGTKEKIQNDIYYVTHFSFALDVKIIFLTLRTVFTSKGLYRNI